MTGCRHGTQFRTSDRVWRATTDASQRRGRTFRSGSNGAEASVQLRRAIRTGWEVYGARRWIIPSPSRPVENDCSTCHMPAVRMQQRDAGKDTDVFRGFPLKQFPKGDTAAADGVTCSVCYQIDPAGLGYVTLRSAARLIVLWPVRNWGRICARSRLGRSIQIRLS